ncbi:hypothetical protein NESM_000820900 [Novymonas esmeraldas]|uniref:Uncharacterized protein n=1 Tax=Novymonas esmeraldas TaxID=1808958 RepID=A0AAW0EZN5_9TRYP
MWAVTSRPIQSAEALQLLERYKAEHALCSNQWLLPRHAALLGVRPLHTARLVLPYSAVASSPLSAVPLAALPLDEQRRVCISHPPPPATQGTWLLLERHAGAMRWRTSTVMESFDAAFVRSDCILPGRRLLCAPDSIDAALVSSEVVVLNAQETTNPYLVDTQLMHRELLSQTPFSHSTASALTTVAAQFGYTSLEWVEATKVKTAHRRVRDGEAPHRIHMTSRLRVAHLSQLPVQQQKALVNCISRSALITSMTMSLIFHRQRWRNQLSFGVTPKLLRDDIPCVDGPHARSHHPLLWVTVKSDEPLIGAALEREHCTQQWYFNSQQTETETPVFPDA